MRGTSARLRHSQLLSVVDVARRLTTRTADLVGSSCIAGSLEARSDPADLSGRAAARRARDNTNSHIHATALAVYNPAITARVIVTSHQLVAELFGE